MGLTHRIKAITAHFVDELDCDLSSSFNPRRGKHHATPLGLDSAKNVSLHGDDIYVPSIQPYRQTR